MSLQNDPKSAMTTLIRARFRRLQHVYFSGRLRRITAVVLVLFTSAAIAGEGAADAGTQISFIENLLTWAEKYKLLLGPSAILLSAVISLATVTAQIQTNKSIAKKRATFDYLSRLSWDNDFLEQRKKFLEIRAGDKKMASVATNYEALKNSEDREEGEFLEALNCHTAVKTILNEYEAISVGIFTKTLDEEMVKRNFRQQIVDAVSACDEFIAVTRKNATIQEPEKLYCECQKLVKKWKNGS